MGGRVGVVPGDQMNDPGVQRIRFRSSESIPAWLRGFEKVAMREIIIEWSPFVFIILLALLYHLAYVIFGYGKRRIERDLHPGYVYVLISVITIILFLHEIL